MIAGTGESDSQRHSGGSIPGAPGIAAYSFEAPDPSVIPVLIAAPHGGRAYPRSLLDDLRHPDSVALRLEDRYVDRLAQAVARQTGAGLLMAQAPRAMIDLNRAPDDVDWDMFARSSRPESIGLPSRRARSGLGLSPRRLPGVGELWRRRHESADLAARIEGIHRPYHEALAAALAALRDRWGVALLVDLHSMPPLQARPGMEAPHFVVGDRFGTTCHGSLVAGAFSWFAANRQLAAHKRPYAGGYVLERHAAPGEGIHALQLEVDRRCYLDSRLSEPGEGMGQTVDLLAGLVRRLAAGVSELAGKGWAQAAE